jgi:hypothetical protein
MKVVVVEWGPRESPETMIETYSVDAIMEAILLARVTDKLGVVEAFQEQYKD